ncbi:peptidoglycan-binding domain-containing protein [Croceiramulus getboli]|nr:peptidoglycan-binding protein [Flavobacteriaceae bacterium YJPT1-3]
MAALELGNVDRGNMPTNIREFLNTYHRDLKSETKRRLQWRDEANGAWKSFKEIPGKDVEQLQRFLKQNGFFPNARCSGIFGYGTLAAARLFQEYVRTVENKPDIGVADGIVGSKTWAHIDRWKRDGVVNTWSQWNAHHPSPENKMWFELLESARSYFQQQKGGVLEQIRTYPAPSDTLPPEHWTYHREEPHLIGIRRNQDQSAENRTNDDLFILLIKGLCFTFWGSTDPNAALSRKDEPFLVESQHKYRIGWHWVSQDHKVYKALKPYANGVLCHRDVDNDNALSEQDLKVNLKDVPENPNKTINIHWSGDGDYNFSAGCQVIAGKSYISNNGEMIDHRKFASDSYAGLAAGKTRGAYNVITDLVACYTPLGRDYVWYTLGNEARLNQINPNFSKNFTQDTVKKLKFT